MRRVTQSVLVLLALSLAGCGGSRATGPSASEAHEADVSAPGVDSEAAGMSAYGGYDPDVEPERDDPSALSQALGAQERALAEELASPEPRCEVACELGVGICQLSGRICEIAGRHPSDAELSGRCQDADARCERARESIAERCTCEE